MVRISLSTAATLGLVEVKCDVAPNVGYVLMGDHCSDTCVFCPLAGGKDSNAANRLRATWPAYDLPDLIKAIQDRPGMFKRLCLRVTHPAEPHAVIAAIDALKQTGLPVSVSAPMPSDLVAAQYISAGADKLNIPLHGVTPKVFAKIRGGDWNQRFALLESTARSYPERVSTHLVIGFGETEADYVSLFARLGCLGVETALFPYYHPKRGGPDISIWRRLQVACHILTRVDWRLVDSFRYDRRRRITSVGIGPTLWELLADGRAFRTGGCPDCNRPWFGEPPGSEPYNFPRPLTVHELEQALSRLAIEE